MLILHKTTYYYGIVYYFILCLPSGSHIHHLFYHYEHNS